MSSSGANSVSESDSQEFANTSSPNSSHEVPKKSRSKVYSFFTYKEEKDRYFCNHCSSSYAKQKDGSTGPMKKHLDTKHWHLFHDLKDPQPSVKVFMSKNDSQIFTKDGLLKRLVNFIVCTNQPFSIVEETSFKDLIKFCNSEAQVPSRKTISNEIKKLYDEEKNNIKEILQNSPGKISFIIDCWTSKNQWPFLGVIAQWIDLDWKLNTLAIDLKCLEGHHTGANLAAAFWSVIEDYGIQNKIMGITTDNTGNMDTFFSNLEQIAHENGVEFDSANYRSRCLAHILNLCCVDSIKSVEKHVISENDINDQDLIDMGVSVLDKGIISKLRKCVVKIRSSPQRKESFRRQCEVANAGDLELILDVTTRWNSTYNMIMRALKLRVALDCTIRNDKDLTRFLLSEEEWEMLDYFKDYLEIFQDVTKFLSSDEFPTISYCSLIYNCIFIHLEKYVKEIDEKTQKPFPDWLKKAAQCAIGKLEKYYKTTDNIAYIMGTVLDPRCKLETFKNVIKFRPEIVTSYKKKAVSVWNTYKPETNVAEIETTPAKQNIFSHTLSKIRKLDNIDEFERYLKENIVSSEFGALNWWKDHKGDFPNISKMAMDFMTICGTGVPVERLFSFGPDLLRNRRLSMKPDTITRCICLKYWLRWKSSNKSTNTEIISAIIDKIHGETE